MTGTASGPSVPQPDAPAPDSPPGGADSGWSGPANPSKHSPWLVLFVLCLGFFMILLDTTIVNIAIPDMIDKLDASLDQVLWVLNAYILVYAVLLIPAGRLGDLYGPKRLFLIGLVIFTAASVACGLSRTPEQLIAARIVQGIGGALLTPQTLSMLTVIFPPEKRGAAFGIWGAVAGVATIAGPTLGGLIVTNWGWSWVFYVNLPVGLATIALSLWVMPNLKLNRRHRLDWAGTLLVTAGLFCVTYGLIEGQPHDWGRAWGPITIPEIIIVGVLLLAAFLWLQYAQRDGEPLVPFTIFRNRNFSVMNLVAGAIGFGMLGLFLPLTIFMQSVLGFSALKAGLATAPMSLVSMFVAPVAGRLADRIGGKYLLMAGLSFFAIGMGMVIAASHVGVGVAQLMPGLIVAGLGLGLTFAPMQTIAMRDIQPRMAGAASGLINTTRQLGAVLGSAAVGALLQYQLAIKLTASAKANAGSLPAALRDQFVSGFAHAQSSGIQVGAGQTGARVPANVPEQARALLAKAATVTFHEGYINAMRVTLWLPVAALALAALSCLWVRRRPTTAGPTPVPAEPAAAPPG